MLTEAERAELGRWARRAKTAQFLAKTLQHTTLSPSRIGDIVRATLVLIHFEHGKIN